MGALFFYLSPRKTIESTLQKWSSDMVGNSRLQKFFHNIIVHFVLAKYYSKNTSSKEREVLKYMCMGSDSGVIWAENYAKRGFPNEKTKMESFWGLLDNKLSDNTILHVHQVACGSGREVAYYAKKYPKIKFIGSDIDESVVTFCKGKWGYISNLTFQVVRLDRLNEKEKKILKCDLIYASGGLQYLDEANLIRFFKIINGLSKQIIFAQPLAIDFLMDKHKHSKKRGNFSWNHPYTSILRQAGWQNITYSVSFVEKDYWAKTVDISAEIQ